MHETLENQRLLVQEMKEICDRDTESKASLDRT